MEKRRRKIIRNENSVSLLERTFVQEESREAPG